MEKVLRFFLISLCVLPLFADFAVKSFQELRNQNLVRQSYEESCGAASLATLIRLIDFKRVDELEVLEYFTKDSKGNINTDMVSFLELQKAAQKMGYKAASYQLDRNALQKLSFPLLVKIEDDPRFPHFVVIINYEGDYIRVFDPSHGEYLSLKNEFYSVWDKDHKGGYALILTTPKGIATEQLPPKLPEEVFFEAGRK